MRERIAHVDRSVKYLPGRREALEAGLPANAGVAAHLGCREAGMSQRDPGSSIDRLEEVGHDARGSWCPRALPGVDQLSRRIDLAELPLECISASPGQAGRSPTATRAHV